MLASDHIDEVICLLAAWDRQTLISEFLAYHSHFPVDLTPDYLSKLTDEKIRHLFLAMCLQNQRVPEGTMVGV
jgi:hypothetical protein